MKKTLLLILPLALLLISLNKVKADTFTYSYNDPSLVSPPGCNSSPDNIITPDNTPVECTDSGDRIIKASINYNPSYNNTNNYLNILIGLQYSICTYSNNCFDGNDANIYNGESSLVLNSYDFIDHTALDLMFNNNQHHFLITTSNCISSNCNSGDIEVRSGGNISFTINLSNIKSDSDSETRFLPIIDNYTVSSGFTPKIDPASNNNPFSLQSSYISNQVFLDFKCGETSQQVIDNYYKTSGGDYYNKVYDPYMSYEDYYNNFNTVGVSGINEMLYGNPKPDFTGSDSGSLDSGGTMCVPSGLVPNGYLYDLGSCTPSPLVIECPITIIPTLKLR